MKKVQKEKCIALFKAKLELERRFSHFLMDELEDSKDDKDDVDELKNMWHGAVGITATHDGYASELLDMLLDTLR